MCSIVFVLPYFSVVGTFCGFERRSMLKNFGCDFFWPWVGGVPWGKGAREDCWCDYDRSVYGLIGNENEKATLTSAPRHFARRSIAHNQNRRFR